ncbi:MAG: tRNA pseudouridine(55) synthase TruB [Propionivibrio sp.]
MAASDSRIKRAWQRVDGVLLLDKATGITSNAALQGARRLFSAAKAGHTGTLDPLATGLLPLCFGEATKFSADLLDADKTYEAGVQFGVTTDTGDAEGRVLRRCRVTFRQSELDAAMASFRGAITQIPPMYSALKLDGKPLYRLARQGIEVERTPRQVSILELELLEYSGEFCRFRISCSKGTYIRTLMEDIGNVLGCGAHLAALRRVAVGELDVSSAFTMDHLAALSESERAACLLPPDALLQSLPIVSLDENASFRFCHGNPVLSETALLTGKCRVYAANRLLGVGEIDAAGYVKPRRLVCL